jgi:hypothetical protein
MARGLFRGQRGRNLYDPVTKPVKNGMLFLQAGGPDPRAESRRGAPSFETGGLDAVVR